MEPQYISKDVHTAEEAIVELAGGRIFSNPGELLDEVRSDLEGVYDEDVLRVAVLGLKRKRIIKFGAEVAAV